MTTLAAMRLRVKHISRYSYSSKVFVEPQHLYLHPAYRPHLKIEGFQLHISPEPDGKAQRTDAEGNIYYQVWYNGLISEISIQTSFYVELTPFNPFNFLAEEVNQRNPILKNYLKKEEALDEAINKWAASILESSDSNITFLSNLTNKMHEKWQHVIREDEGILSPNVTFLQESASCRDLSWMMMQMLRHVNFPCRFVSGYSFNPELDGHELHAWVEAWVDGAGWVGLDPSSGLLTSEVYIPLTASHDPQFTLPVQGAFRGNANSKLETTVHLEQL